MSKKIRLTKVTHLMDIPHPNGIDEGFEVIGTTNLEPEIGINYVVSRYNGGYLVTSPITEVISSTHFKTKNSEYKIVDL